jgi:hypothetical protein
MNRTTIFTGLFVLMLVFAGYLYWFSGPVKPEPAAVKAAISPAGFDFVHPINDYTLKLPFDWKDKYSVSETADQTDFWYGEPGIGDLLFSIRRGADSAGPQSGEIRRLAEYRGSYYTMIVPDRRTEAKTKDNAAMRRSVYEIADTLKIKESGQDGVIREALSKAASTTLDLAAFQTIATDENASTSIYYIWALERHFGWENGFWRDWPILDRPLAVYISKSGGENSVRAARSGPTAKKDLAAIFPASVRNSVVFAPTTTEHAALIEKLSAELDNRIVSYFGSEPVLLRAGVVEQAVFSPGKAPTLKIKLGSVRIVAGKKTGTSTQILDLSRQSADYAISSNTAPLILPIGLSGRRSTTSLTVLPADLGSVFGPGATSTWRKKNFWFALRGTEILRIYPF